MNALESPGSMTLQRLGIRAIVETRLRACPFSTILLADMGAEVVKSKRSGDTGHGQNEVTNNLSWTLATFKRKKTTMVVRLQMRRRGRALSTTGEASPTTTTWKKVAGN